MQVYNIDWPKEVRVNFIDRLKEKNAFQYLQFYSYKGSKFIYAKIGTTLQTTELLRLISDCWDNYDSPFKDYDDISFTIKDIDYVIADEGIEEWFMLRELELEEDWMLTTIARDILDNGAGCYRLYPANEKVNPNVFNFGVPLRYSSILLDALYHHIKLNNISYIEFYQARDFYSWSQATGEKVERGKVRLW